MPDKPKEDKSQEPGISRSEALKKGGNSEPDMPPIDAKFMIDYLHDIGPTMGDKAVTHGEIESWQRNTGIELDSWQACALHRLSVEFLAFSRIATKIDCPPPWKAASLPPVPNAKAESLRARLRALRDL